MHQSVKVKTGVQHGAHQVSISYNDNQWTTLRLYSVDDLMHLNKQISNYIRKVKDG